ncbi:ROK family protein [Patescibacteria group bacterium]|nr:MAG: ROK family protein [Patescibacteria group bacterium]
MILLTAAASLVSLISARSIKPVAHKNNKKSHQYVKMGSGENRKYKEVSTHICLPLWAPSQPTDEIMADNNIMTAPCQRMVACLNLKRYTRTMYIGVDIGGSKILVVAGNAKHQILRQQKIKTPEDGHQGVIEIIHLIEQVAAGDEIKSIIVASAGPLDFKNGCIRESSPNMHGWRGTKLIEPIKNHFKRPTELVADTAAAAVTEATIGAAKGEEFVLYVTISTGVGAALVAGGEAYQGVTGIEAGHIIIDPDGPPCGCGGRGHFEAMVSGKAIKKKYGLFGYQITDPKIWDEIAATMALGFHSLIVSYSPSVIVIGGGVGVHYAKFHDFLMKHLAELHPLYPLPEIRQAKYIETAVAYGALILAAQHYSS